MSLLHAMCIIASILKGLRSFYSYSKKTDNFFDDWTFCKSNTCQNIVLVNLKLLITDKNVKFVVIRLKKTRCEENKEYTLKDKLILV